MISNQQPITVQLNNYGASLLRGRNYAKAIATLSEAFKLNKVAFNVHIDEMYRGSKHCFGLDHCIISSRQIHNECCDECIDPSIFCHAIYIPSDLDISSYRSKITVSGAVVFNLALAHHAFAMEMDCRELREQVLRKAAKLYELGYNLQRAQGMITNSLFALAAINNIGQIFESLGEREKAQTCFNHLLSTLMFLIDCRQVNVTQFDCFFRNTSHLIFQRGASTAEAA